MTLPGGLAGLAAVLAVAGAAEIVPRGRPRRRDGPGAAVIRMLAAAGAGIRGIARARAPAGLEQRIAAAGAPAGLGSRELIAAKLGGAGVGAVAALVLAAPAPGRLGMLLAIAVPVAGFLAPDWWLARRARERAARVRRDLPALLDLLRVSIEAGLSPVAALAAVGSRSQGPLAARAREARLARSRGIEEEAGRAGPNIQLVVALLLVPSVLLLVAAALATALLGGGGSALPLGG